MCEPGVLFFLFDKDNNYMFLFWLVHINFVVHYFMKKKLGVIW